MTIPTLCGLLRFLYSADLRCTVRPNLRPNLSFFSVTTLPTVLYLSQNYYHNNNNKPSKLTNIVPICLDIGTNIPLCFLLNPYCLIVQRLKESLLSLFLTSITSLPLLHLHFTLINLVDPLLCIIKKWQKRWKGIQTLTKFYLIKNFIYTCIHSY